ncbi:MAG TPA: endonuclease/exonuclease/phosphatase family protein [Bryobacteraceae bacterium]|nr:endonuclease/exonuclease/phosphatase family protein [Bryobacteraceae bacterium]
MRFRAATYNIHKCRGMDWRVRPDRIATILEEMDADIIALQEVREDQISCFSRTLRCANVFGPARKLGHMDYGNAIFTRFAVMETKNHDLSVLGREPRACLEVKLQIPDHGALHAFAAHLGTSWSERRRQADKLLSETLLGRPASASPLLLLGDFNEWTAGITTRSLSRHMQSVNIRAHLGRARTYPGLLPFLHLDHIYHDRALRLVGMRFVRTRLSLIASDHLPLIADFEW